ETGIGLGEGLLNCAKKSETYFLFDESELAHEEVSAAGEDLTDTFRSELVSRNAFRGGSVSPFAP
ncbi:hypothetical protein, partial [Pseudomonas syringae]